MSKRSPRFEDDENNLPSSLIDGDEYDLVGDDEDMVEELLHGDYASKISPIDRDHIDTMLLREAIASGKPLSERAKQLRYREHYYHKYRNKTQAVYYPVAWLCYEYLGADRPVVAYTGGNSGDNIFYLQDTPSDVCDSQRYSKTRMMQEIIFPTLMMSVTDRYLFLKEKWPHTFRAEPQIVKRTLYNGLDVRFVDDRAKMMLAQQDKRRQKAKEKKENKVGT